MKIELGLTYILYQAYLQLSVQLSDYVMQLLWDDIFPKGSTYYHVTPSVDPWVVAAVFSVRPTITTECIFNFSVEDKGKGQKYAITPSFQWQYWYFLSCEGQDAQLRCLHVGLYKGHLKM